jgi:hypothetical protein
MAKESAWKRVIYRGTAGSAAGTLITPNVVDIGMGREPERTETTSRGNGSAVPKKTEMVVCMVATPGPFSMIYDAADTHMAALLAAAAAGTPLAFLIKASLTGATEFDGDCTIGFDAPGGLKDGKVVTFTLAPTDEAGRDWT